jgi:hypothetical protein
LVFGKTSTISRRKGENGYYQKTSGAKEAKRLQGRISSFIEGFQIGTLL